MSQLSNMLIIKKIDSYQSQKKLNTDLILTKAKYTSTVFFLKKKNQNAKDSKMDSETKFNSKQNYNGFSTQRDKQMSNAEDPKALTKLYTVFFLKK